MNNEKYNQIVDEAYRNYLIEDSKIMPNFSKEKMYEFGHRLTKEEFINKCKNEPEFSEKWGLKIEQRDLSWEERDFPVLRHSTKLITITYKAHLSSSARKKRLVWRFGRNLRLVLTFEWETITYKDEKIEVYE